MNLNNDFNDLLANKVLEVEKIVCRYLPSVEGSQKVIMDAMEYSVTAGGKRLRPLLMSETSKLFEKETKAIFPFMAAQEMIHTYSLVHDDLPAMDNDEYRRGRPTTWSIYGEAMGVLAGDALLNYAFETAATAFEVEQERIADIAKALQILSKKAGIYGMIGGQVIDVQETGHEINQEILDKIYELKTAALIESSMMIGAVLGGASEEEIKKIEAVAKNIGLAFQIQDDILDVTSTTEVLGKPINSDEKNKKTTYVTLFGIEEASKIVEIKTKEAIDLLQTMPRENKFLEQLLLKLVYRKK